MNAHLQEIRDPQRLRFEADLALRVGALFNRWPALCGFVVRDGLTLTEVTCHPAPYGEQADVLLGEIAGMLLEVVDEQPEAAGLLNSRTFARSVH